MATACDNEAPDCPKHIITPLSGQQTGNNEKITIKLDGVAKTLLIPLIARVYDNNLPEPILGDPYAKDVLEKIEVDVDAMSLTPFKNGGIALRTSQMDRWAAAFLKNNANATVLHLACGFDSRMQRVEWGERTRWSDIDLPEVIELRKKIQPLSLPGRDYSLIGVDVLDENWMQDIGEVSGPVLVIMEGLLAYLPEKDARGLLQRISQTFSEGEMLFESVSSATLKWLNRPESLKAVSETGTQFQSSIDDPMALEDLHPHLKLAESVPVVQLPGTEKLPLVGRMLMYFTSWFPSGRDSARLLRFRFGEAKSLGVLQ
ncbi:S-adenosyl-L-methionine-dependent methyltransferase [Penicillium riverlandense]|uniref:S-adenosyl-L-methionine-dependent methyltransferase n=1 Tax=Penicillium riverlandense TaxID=1903569 RepID=UPI0025489ECC|nr:S-adenosyl-L-methionine-dependent methyltransferase [Penicillium riverlandense]KAJ5811578.1 S-adenosyl-L-methionine-dependent methyltransferase [Penicillium riverlandense]